MTPDQIRALIADARSNIKFWLTTKFAQDMGNIPETEAGCLASLVDALESTLSDLERTTARMEAAELALEATCDWRPFFYSEAAFKAADEARDLVANWRRLKRDGE